ncbi:MAG: glycosyltransferase family 4 protein [Acidobacteriota bacterium]
MLVGFDATTMRGNKTGVGYYTARLLESLTVVGGEDNPIEELAVLSNLEVALPSGLPRVSVFSGGRLSIRAVWMQGILPFILKRLRPDVCHFTNFLAPIVTESPFVVTFHDMSLQLMPRYHTLKKRLMTASLMPLVASKARLIITPSESAREDVCRILGVDREKVRAIPHAPDPLFRRDGTEASFARLSRLYRLRKPYLLYVGTLEPRKNITRALETFARLRDRFPEHVFYLVGDLGWQYLPVLRAVQELRLENRVQRLGYVKERDLPSLYSHAELLVYPSLYEGFGFPVLEAMACGTPVLTSNTSSLAEIAGGAALLVYPLDLSSMTEAMERGLTPGLEREELITGGVTRAASFSWERTTRETLAVYQEAAERAHFSMSPPAESPGHGPTVAGRIAPARAVSETVAYGALFEFPMKLEEIHRGLMGVELAAAQIEALLQSDPEVRARVERRGLYYFLRGRGRDIRKRWGRERSTRDLLLRHRAALDRLCRAPYVRMVALSGAAAHGNAADGDIDLFLIAAPGRTWAVSFLLFVAAKLAGLRHVMCVNYLVSEKSLALPERDPFTANQIVSLKPLAGRPDYLRFVKANDWGAAYFPNFWKLFRECAPSNSSCPPAGSFWLEALLSFGGGWLLERTGRLLLGGYLRFKHRRAGCPSSVKLEGECIKLHFKDHGAPLGARLQAILGEIDDEAKAVAGRA